MSERADVVARLAEFYQAAGISRHGFRCPHWPLCTADASGRELASGAEAHVGTHYGTVMRIAFVSLDTGGGVADLERRTKVIEALPGQKLNPHMKGTRTMARALLAPEIGDAEPYPYFAMINAAKCSGADNRMDMVPGTLYDRCREFGRGELEVLLPSVVVAQGAKARALLPRGEEIGAASVQKAADVLQLGDDWLVRWLGQLAKRYLRWVRIQDCDVLAVLTPHPSARGGQWQRFVAIDLTPVVKLITALLGERAA